MRSRRAPGSCAALAIVVAAIAFVGGRACEYAHETVAEDALDDGRAPAPRPTRVPANPSSHGEAARTTTGEAREEPRERTGDPGPTPSRPGGAPSPAGALDDLRRRTLAIPVSGVTAAQLRPTFEEARAEHQHEALDIMAPRGTPVVAVEEGRVAKLFTSRQGGLTIYQFDPTERYAFYYAHLDRYAEGLREGQQLARGELIGYVGSTGNASPDAPHLHFAIFALGPEKRWWQGSPIDPFLVWR